jgi:hypothetical protein
LPWQRGAMVFAGLKIVGSSPARVWCLWSSYIESIFALLFCAFQWYIFQKRFLNRNGKRRVCGKLIICNFCVFHGF